MSTLTVRVDGVGIWAGPWQDWNAAREALRENVENAPISACPRPTPDLLPATERRRAPESVLLAVEVAQQACTMAQRDPADLPHVFASAYGDLAINDYLCATLARAPLEISPTKFHNSVHNAPAGYWTIATGCRASSASISAGEATFATGLLEAALYAQSEAQPVLLVACDVAACGPLADVVVCDVPFAVALVLSPPALARPGAPELRLALMQRTLAAGADVLHAWAARNPAARCLPLLAALARRSRVTLESQLAPESVLVMETLF